MRYRLIGLDLDGTFLHRTGRPSDRNLAAVAAAQKAGVMVVPVTGRGWRESRAALAGFPNPGVGSFVTGAAIADITTGQSLDIAVIEPHLSLAIIEQLRTLPEAVLLLRDAAVTGHDYLVTGRGTLTANTQWWFQLNRATIQFVADPGLEDLRHTLRVGVVATGSRVMEAAACIREKLGDRVNLHHFDASPADEPEDSVHLLEVFAHGVDKWRGLSWIARQHGIEPKEVAMIGDEINDLSAMRCAGCAIAMGNAVPAAKAVADHVTLDCDNDGAAHAIEQLLSGQWGRLPKSQAGAKGHTAAAPR